MTVADNTSRNQYTATSGQTVFAYTFEIVDKDDIVVLKNGTTLSEGTDYTVSNVGNDSGGNVTLTTGATTGDIITLYRDMPYARTQNYQNAGDFLASEVNADFDNLWLASEQVNRGFTQSVRKPITDSDTISMELPDAATRAGKVLGFDSNGAVQTIDELQNIAYETGTWTPVASDAATGGNTMSLIVRNSSYTKIGNLVFAAFTVDSIDPSAGVGIFNFVLQGLPYPPSSNNPAGTDIYGGYAETNGVTGGPHACETRRTGSSGYLLFPILTRTSAGSHFLAVEDMSNNASIQGSITYITDG